MMRAMNSSGAQVREAANPVTTASANQPALVTSLFRLADDSDVTNLVRFLLGDGARMITGQTILVDGGVSV